jgi:hypothetical protein
MGRVRDYEKLPLLSGGVRRKVIHMMLYGDS